MEGFGDAFGVDVGEPDGEDVGEPDGEIVGVGEGESDEAGSELVELDEPAVPADPAFPELVELPAPSSRWDRSALPIGAGAQDATTPMSIEISDLK